MATDETLPSFVAAVSDEGTGQRARVHQELLRVEVSEEEEERRAKMPKTIGERAYNGIQFWFVKGLILAATAVIGYQAKFGKDTNFIRKIQKWCLRWVKDPIANAGEKAGASLAESMGGDRGKWIGAKTHEVIAVFGGAFASTMVIFHGGNVVAPIVQWFENHRKGIIANVNRHWGKPGDEARGNEKFEFLPHQTAGDVVKGRITAWLTVFASFFTAFLVIGKMKGISNPSVYRLDWFEEKCARAVSGFGKKSPFAHLPMNYELPDLVKADPQLFAGQERNIVWYKTAKILALDIYATTMSILVWNFASRLSARSRRHHEPFLDALKNTLTGKKHHHHHHPVPQQETVKDAADTHDAPAKKEEKKPATEKPAADERHAHARKPDSVVSHAVAIEPRQADVALAH